MACASSRLAGAGVASRRPESPEQRASRRGERLVDGRSRRGRSRVRAARPRGRVQGDRQGTGHGDSGRSCAERHRSRPLSNTIARSNWRVRGGALADLRQARVSWRTPRCMALPQAATDHGRPARTGVCLVLDRNCRCPCNRHREREPRTGPMTDATHRRLATPPSSVLAVQNTGPPRSTAAPSENHAQPPRELPTHHPRRASLDHAGRLA